MKAVIEICVDCLESVQVCADAGVDRIELCSALSEGGLTPSHGFLRTARKIFPGTVMMMIRPRSGDFLYSDEEMEIMKDDIRCAANLGADGVVFGCLNATGVIDREKTMKLLDVSQQLDVTFHRAFDVTRDLVSSLETLIGLGIPRVLTSGGEADVWQGLPRLRDLNEQAAGRIVVLPGGGVTARRINELIEATGVKECHLSARHSVPSPMMFQRDDIAMGSSRTTPESIRQVTDPAQLHLLLSSLSHHS